MMCNRLTVTIGLCFLGLLALAQPANDDPCNAIELNVDNSCNFSNYTNLAATASAGVPTPGCASYSGGDVWFTFRMPNNGYHTILEMSAAGMTDGGMAIYRGTDCSNLALVSCDDNSGIGNMPSLTLEDGCSFQDTGTLFWVRVWENGNNNNGTFDICAYAQAPNIPSGVTSCSGNLISGDACCDAILLGEDLDGYCGTTSGYTDIPDEIPGFNNFFVDNNSFLGFIASDSTAQLLLTSSNCLNSNGIQVAVFETSDCTNYNLVSDIWNLGSEGSGTVTAMNLTIGATYYIMVDGWAGDECDYSISVISGVQTVTVSATDYELCQGETTQLLADVLGSGTYTYSWSPASSLDDPSSATPIASPNTSTDYTVTITGIEDSIHTVSVTVFPNVPGLPTISGSSGVCQNTTGHIYYGTSINAVTYDWQVTGGTISGGNTADSLIVDWGTMGGTVCLQGINDCGTSMQRCMIVNTAVQPDITANNPPVACAPDPFDLTTIQVTNNASQGGPVTYHLNLLDAETGSNPINPPVVNTSGTYYIRMETGSDCYDIASADVVIEEPELLVIDPAPKCSPDFVDLATVPANEINGYGGGTKTYFADSLEAVNSMPQLSSTQVFSSGTYWIRYETPNGCADIAPVEVVIDITPALTVVQPAPLCPGGSIDLDTITLIDANGATFTKYFYNNQSLAILGLPSLALSNTVVTTPMSYYLRAETANGCVQIVEITITGGVAPSGEITGGGTFCDGDNTDLTFNLTGSGPFDVVYSDGSNFFPLNNIPGNYIETVSVSGNVTYSLFSIWDANGCSGTITGTDVTITANPAPTATIIGNVTVCGNSNVDLTFNFSGSGPFDIEYSDGINSPVQVNGISNGHIESVSVSSNTNFTLVSVNDALSCTGTVSGTANITVLQTIQVINVLENCSPSYLDYTVSFEVSGGDGGPYTVGGITGSWSGNTFTSDPITSGNAYSLNIDDNSSCPAQILNGSQNCQCATDAGTMDSSLLGACEGGIVSAIHSGDEFLNSGELIQFVLHDDPGATLGNIFAISDNPDFGIQLGMATGITYYISSIAGPDNGSGNVDTAHICFSIAPGTPVVFYESPAASISGGATICSGSSAFCTINFSAGNGPFDVTVFDGSTSITLEDIADGYQHEVFPTSNTSYTITNVTDNTVAACSGTFSGSAFITVVDAPAAGVPSIICNPINTAYQVSFSISGGDQGTYIVNGDPGTIDNMTQTFTSDWINSGTVYNFVLNDGNNCNPETISGTFVCNCTSNAGSMATTSIIVCEDEMASAQHNAASVVLDGNDALGFVLHDNPGTSLGNVMNSNTTADFSFDSSLNYGVTYYISAVVGNDDGSGFPVLDTNIDPCLSVTAGQPVVFIQTPTAAITGSTTICQGESTDITFNLTGSGPFNLEYSDGVSTFTLTAVNNGHILPVNPTAATTYSLVSVSLTGSPFCTGTIDVNSNYIFIDVIEVPQITGLSSTCNTAGTEFQISFNISGGNAGNYSVQGNSGTLTGASFVSDWILSGSTYSFQVDDGSGCPSEEYTATEYCNCTPDIRPLISIRDEITCNGENDGALSVENINGSLPVSYSWSTNAQGDNISGLNSNWYFVTMTDANNCESIDSIFLGEPTPIEGELIAEPPSCFGDNDGSIAFENVQGGAGEYTYSLNYYTSFTNNEFYNLPAGTYQGTITDAQGCEWTEEIAVEEATEYTLNIGEDLSVELGATVRINPQTNAFVDTFKWSSNLIILCEPCWEQEFVALETQTFTLTVIEDSGCVITDDITIHVSRERPVFIPTAFSPNGDGFNDRFMIYPGPAVEQIKMLRIFDRWGALVFEAKDIFPGDINYGWDGYLKDEQMGTGVYIYFAEILFADGESIIHRGDVTLLR